MNLEQPRVIEHAVPCYVPEIKCTADVGDASSYEAATTEARAYVERATVALELALLSYVRGLIDKNAYEAAIYAVDSAKDTLITMQAAEIKALRRLIK